MKQRVVVIGRGYSGRLSIIRSLAEVDCDITIISLLPTMKLPEKTKRNDYTLDAYSKYVSRVFYSESYNTEMLLDILLNKCVDATQKTIIFPDNDFSAAVLDEYREQLKAYFYIPHIKDTAGAVKEWMDKVKQKALAKTVGLNVAQAVLIEVRDKQFTIPDTISYPCFAKPLLSIAGGKSALKRCDTENELHKHITYVGSLRPDVSILVEEYKEIDKEYATLGFSDGKNVVIPGLLEFHQIGHGSHFGVAIQGRAFPIDGYEDLVEKFKKLVIEIGFVGIFDIDFFESGGIMYFCELNLRFGGSGYAFTKLGVNLPVMMMKSFLGEDIQDMNKAINQTAFYFNERMAIDDWYGGYISTEKYYQLRDASEIKFVACDNDPLPQKRLEKEFRMKRIKKTIKGWMGKK